MEVIQPTNEPESEPEPALSSSAALTTAPTTTEQRQQESPLRRNSTMSSKSNKRCIAPDTNSESASQAASISASQSASVQHSYQKNHKRKKRRKYIYTTIDKNGNTYNHNVKNGGIGIGSSAKGGKKKHCMSELLNGVLIYAICIFTPVIFGVLVK
jgi:hypothetical protein